MRPRLIAIGVLLAISLVAGVASAFALPAFDGAIVVRGMVGVLAFFVAFIVLAKIMNVVWPAPAMIASNAVTKAMRSAPERAVSEASPGSYVRMRGTLEAAGEPLEAPLSRRPCLAYRVTRTPIGRKSGAPNVRQRGVRSRLVDPTGAIEVELEGTEWTKTGDALADAIMEKAQSAMGDRARLDADLEFPKTHRARVEADGGTSSQWPAGIALPGAERLAEIRARDFSDPDPNDRRRAAHYEEDLLVAGETVEVIGMIREHDGKLVLGGPANHALQVRPRR